MANRADRIDQADGIHMREGKPKAPPEYHGPDHADKNQAEFARRRECGACFHCPLNKVDYNLWHTLCPAHGRDSKSADRRKGVKGAGRIF